MVANLLDPILLIALPMALAFMLPLVDKAGRAVTHAVHMSLLAGLFGLTAWWTWGMAHGAPPMVIETGGWAPPVGIALQLGLTEGLLVLLAQGGALASALYLRGRDSHRDLRAIALQIALLIGATGLIMTRDFFNIFVFVEITGIATYALALTGREERSLEAGFKYMLVGSAASVFLLLGISMLYKHTGHLNLDAMQAALATGSTGSVAVALGIAFMMLLVAFAAELKLFPVNGPALDLYEGIDPGVSALLVTTAVNGYLFAFFKVLPLFPANWAIIVASLGMVTFVGSNLMANRQTSIRRMLGYSSSAQVGLLVGLLPFVVLKQVALLPILVLVVNHTLAKATLLWLAGHGERLNLSNWKGAFSRQPLARLALVGAILAITGLPPFPGFFGKWEILVSLAGNHFYGWFAAILIGSLLEFGYYYKWLREVQSGEDEAAPAPLAEQAGPWTFGALLLTSGVAFALWRFPELSGASGATAMLLGVGLALALTRDMIPMGAGAVALLALLGALGMTLGAGAVWTDLPGLFSLMALGGGVASALAALAVPRLRGSYHGAFLGLVGSVLMLVQASDFLTFFVGWELMTWVSYVLIAQGRDGARPGWVYMLFSGAAGFLLLGGMLVALGEGVTGFSGLAQLQGGYALAAWSLLVLGVLVKIGAVGAHIWAPGAYTESPDAYTAFLSGVISKVPVFALVLVLSHLGAGAIAVAGYSFELTHALAWIGGLTALIMSLLAVFQEDAKKLLAYSSVGQLGYVVVGLAIMSPLGWTSALYHAVHHLGFKAMLFLVIAGVIHRTGTRQMYQMGGLIHRMPFSFLVAMLGIIALSGVPPMGGFVGKWTLYIALMEKGWLFLTALMMFSSLVAFLYLYRFIHTVFLGQLKTRHQAVREAPLPYLLGQGLLLALVGVVTVWPQALLVPISRMLPAQLGSQGLAFEGNMQVGTWSVSGSNLVTSMGSYDTISTLFVVVAVFGLSVGLLWLSVPKARKVGQLDIVYAGEVPPPPEEIHYAFDFHRPYERVFGAVLKGSAVRFWRGFADAVEALAETGRGLYTGNGQTYLLYFFGLAALLGAIQLGL